MFERKENYLAEEFLVFQLIEHRKKFLCKGLSTKGGGGRINLLQGFCISRRIASRFDQKDTFWEQIIAGVTRRV